MTHPFKDKHLDYDKEQPSKWLLNPNERVLDAEQNEDLANYLKIKPVTDQYFKEIFGGAPNE